MSSSDNLNITMPERVSYIIQKLEEAGHEAYAVGGCVRDSMLGREPQDWDITTSALPEETKAIFSRTVDTGIKHGTVTAMFGKEGYEITTYRVDGKYSDSRHPDSVEFTRSLEEDLKRRDFTINAMACNSDGLVDMFGGKDDLENGLIRCVGVPEARFGEDALRILRAVRFSAQLGFDIDPATLEAARKLAPTLANISAERIHSELHKLLMSDWPDRLVLLHELGIDRVILPELERTAKSGRMNELCARLAGAPYDTAVRWALLLLYTGSASEIMHRLKFDNQTIYTVKALLRFRQVPVTVLDPAGMRRLMSDSGRELMEPLFAFIGAADPDLDLTGARRLCRSIIDAGDCTDIKSLAVNGHDLMQAGIPAGKSVGETLERLLSAVLADPSLNTPEKLLELALNNKQD